MRSGRGDIEYLRVMKISTLIAGMLVSLVMSYIVYFGFTTNYTRFSFSRESFLQQYNHDVYKYRIVSKYLLLETEQLLNNIQPTKKADWRILILDSSASNNFYYAYFLLNTLFLMLSSIVLALLLDMETQFSWSRGEKRLLLFFLPILICLTQFVICPYDVCSYFFQLLTIYVFLEYFDRYYWTTIFITGFLIILGTLNRESSALTVAYLVLVIFGKKGLTMRAWTSITSFAGCFLVPYLALRLLIKDPPGWHSLDTIDKFQLNLQWDLSHWGLIFWALFSWLAVTICRSRENKGLIFFYYLTCLPYIYTCVVYGVLWELRLFIPIFIGAVLLSGLDTNRLQSPLAIYARKTGWL